MWAHLYMGTYFILEMFKTDPNLIQPCSQVRFDPTLKLITNYEITNMDTWPNFEPTWNIWPEIDPISLMNTSISYHYLVLVLRYRELRSNPSNHMVITPTTLSLHHNKKLFFQEVGGELERKRKEKVILDFSLLKGKIQRDFPFCYLGQTQPDRGSTYIIL